MLCCKVRTNDFIYWILCINLTRVKNVRVDKTKFLSAASCSRKEFQDIVDVMMENVPSDDGKLSIFLYYVQYT